MATEHSSPAVSPGARAQGGRAVEKWKSQMTTLYINRYNCECSCGAHVLGWTDAERCETLVGKYGRKQSPCGQKFTHISSHYPLDRAQIEQIIQIRPDLQWSPPRPDLDSIRKEVLNDV